MDTAAPPVISRGSQAWIRAGIPARYEKLSRKGDAKWLLQVGAGAYGRVYQAYDRESSRYVAVKKMVGIDAAKLARQEFQIGLQLHHPQLVQTLAMGVSPHRHREKAYLVLGFIDGQGLTTWGQAPRQAIIDILDALRYLHSKRMVHGDIHAQNILIGARRAWLVDLGRARTVSRFSRRALCEDVRQVCATIEEGLFMRQQTQSLFGGKPDPWLQAEFDILKESAEWSAWLRQGIVPDRARLFAHAFFTNQP